MKPYFTVALLLIIFLSFSPSLSSSGAPCSPGEVKIAQRIGGYLRLSNGRLVAKYFVEITNTASVPVSDVFVSCAGFSPVSRIDGRIFRKVNRVECIVKDGHALLQDEVVRFPCVYSDSPTPLFISKVRCG